MTPWEIIVQIIAWRRDYPSRRHSFWPDRHSRAFVGFPWYRGHRAIPSDAPHTNHTLETRHLAGSTPDVGSAGHCESVAVAPRTYGFVEPWRRLDEGFTCAAGQFFQRPAGIANQQRHGGARANNFQRASVHAREPTRSLCGAAVATARPAVHFA